jgi:hypothetical protein
MKLRSIFLSIYYFNNFLLDRPESSLTVTSECSSTISSEDDPAEVTHLENSSLRKTSSTQQKSNNVNKVKNEDDVSMEPPISPTGSSISDEMMIWPEPPPPIATTTTSSEVVKSPTKSSNRLSNLFSNMKIPKLKLNRKSVDGKSTSSSPDDVISAGGDKESTQSSKTTISSSRSEHVDLKTSQVKYGRSMSIGSEDGGNFVRGSGERHSYRAPTATSRYMQAAEAYAAKKRTDRYDEIPNIRYSTIYLINPNLNSDLYVT